MKIVLESLLEVRGYFRFLRQLENLDRLRSDGRKILPFIVNAEVTAKTLSDNGLTFAEVLREDMEKA